MAKAFLISPERQTIEHVEVSDEKQIAALIGYETIESDDVGGAGDRLFFDEECFIRGSTGRFQIDRLIPVAGKGVVVGAADDGGPFTDVSLGLDDLRARIRFE